MGACILIYEIQDRGQLCLIKSVIALFQLEKVTSTLEACQELVSSACMIMVAHRQQQPISKSKNFTLLTNPTIASFPPL